MMGSTYREFSKSCWLIIACFWVVPAGAEDYSGYDCLIEPNSVVDVSTREDGVIEEILVRRGDVIEKGQVLARLESNVEIVAVSIARARAAMRSGVDSQIARVAYLQAQKNRVDALYETRAIPFHEKDKADTDLILGKAELREAHDNLALAQLEKERAEGILARRTIKSPIDGVVVEILLDAGESVEENSIMKIADVNPLNVEVILSEDMYGLINVGTQGEVTPHIRGGEKRVTSVVVVDKLIDAASNTFGVRLEFDNADLMTPGGVRCDINFLVDASDSTEGAGNSAAGDLSN
ncbi:efflux RND transporter periplasmic adaptor subunit [Candidatus Litorirhabdus singularis]|nr:efflux RND transporter periplasmic adaptor subunit [Candidatus Litorirhabdus singularis]